MSFIILIAIGKAAIESFIDFIQTKELLLFLLLFTNQVIITNIRSEEKNITTQYTPVRSLQSPHLHGIRKDSKYIDLEHQR